MKVSRAAWLFLFQLHVLTLQSLSVDATRVPMIINDQYTFSDGDYAAGDVCFQGGINVPAGAVVLWAVKKPVNGPINLNGTGTLFFPYGTSLALGPGCPGFVNGGIIATWRSGDGNSTVFIGLNSDISVAGVLQFTGPCSWLLNGYSITFADGDNPGRFFHNIQPQYFQSFAQNLYITGGSLFNMQDTQSGLPRFSARRLYDTPYYVLGGVDMYLSGYDTTMTVTSGWLEISNPLSSINCQSKGKMLLTGDSGMFIRGAGSWDNVGLTVNTGMTLEVDTLIRCFVPSTLAFNQSTLVAPLLQLYGGWGFGGEVSIKGNVHFHVGEFDESTGNVVINPGSTLEMHQTFFVTN